MTSRIRSLGAKARPFPLERDRGVRKAALGEVALGQAGKVEYVALGIELQIGAEPLA